MPAARALALACLALAAPVVSAQAYTLSLRQIGGTAVDGVGYVGGDIVVAIDAALETGDEVSVIAPSLQWDLEGGNVLDLVRATESASVAGGVLAQFHPAYRHGSLDRTVDEYFADGSSFPSLAGPTFTVGWEQAVVVPRTSLFGPASFRIGTATFVFREAGTTTLGFLVDPGHPWATHVLHWKFGNVDETENTTLEELDLSAVEFASLSLTVVVPEPGTALLGGVGLAGLGLASRARRLR